MQNIHDLPTNFLIAWSLGAQIEGYFKHFPGSKRRDENDGWRSIDDFMSYHRDTELRVRAGDESILAIADKIVAENFYTITYKGHNFQVPNHARQVGCVQLEYGFGVMVNQDGEEIGKGYLITTDYTGELPDDYERFKEIHDHGNFVHGKLIT